MAGLLKEITDLPSVTEVTSGLGDFLLIKQGDTDRRIRVRDIFRFHTGNTANPHGTTKAHIGLDKLSNWEETIDYTYPNDDQYANIGAVRRLAEEVDDLNDSKIDPHISNRANPHEVTSTQVGLNNLSNWSQTTDYTYPSDDRYANIGAVRRLAEALALDIAKSTPRGVISMWYGSVGSIPTGYALCNGANGTPDLRNRFVIGAGGSYGVGAKGGATTTSHTHTAWTGGVSLSIAQMPSHNHPLTYWQDASEVNRGNTGTVGGGESSSRNATTYTNYVGSGAAHSHSAATGTKYLENRPPYYALCYIMKL